MLGNTRLRAGALDQAQAAAAAKSAQARARAADVLPYLDAERRASARTLYEVAEVLTNRGVPTAAGKGTWRPEQVRRVLASRAYPSGEGRGGRGSGGLGDVLGRLVPVPGQQFVQA